MPTSPFLAPERDEAAKRGAQRGSTPTLYFMLPGWGFFGTGTVQAGADVDHYVPFFVGTPILVDQLALEVTVGGTAASLLRMGIYRADFGWQPTGPPLADSGTIAADTVAVKTYTPGTPLWIPRGRYLTVYNHNGATAPTIRTFTGTFDPSAVAAAMGVSSINFRWDAARAFAAFPTPGTGWGSGSAGTSQLGMVLLRTIGG